MRSSKAVAVVSGFIALLVAACSASRAPERAQGVNATPGLRTEDSPLPQGPVGLLDYHDGSLMTGKVNVYYVWYGSWAAGAPATPGILTDFAKSVGGSPWLSIVGTYKNASGTPAATQAEYAGDYVDRTLSQGTTLDNAAVVNIVDGAIAADLPADPNGVYFVLAGPDVQFEDEAFPFGAPYGRYCVDFCGYHQTTTAQGVEIKYAFIGDPSACPPSTMASPGCNAITAAQSPNGDLEADTMVNDIAHELTEAITDPDGGGYYSDQDGWELADACAYTWGPTWSPAGTTAMANDYLAGGSGATSRDYLLQELYVNVGSGSCNMIPPSPPPCQVLVGCATEGVSLYCVGRASGDVQFERGDVTVATIPLATTVATANYSAVDSPSGSGSVSYRACTSNGNGGEICTAPTNVTLPLAACASTGAGGSTHHCPTGETWCGTECAVHCLP